MVNLTNLTNLLGGNLGKTQNYCCENGMLVGLNRNRILISTKFGSELNITNI